MLTGTEVDTRRCTVAEILVLGAGLCGLSTAMLLARDGNQVTVLERDPSAPPEPAQAWEAWERRGVNQFRLPHVMLPPWRARMERELPEVLDEGLAAARPAAGRGRALHDRHRAPPGAGGGGGRRGRPHARPHHPPRRRRDRPARRFASTGARRPGQGRAGGWRPGAARRPGHRLLWPALAAGVVA